MYPPAHLHAVGQTTLRKNMHCTTLHCPVFKCTVHVLHVSIFSCSCAVAAKTCCSCCFDNIHGSFMDPVIQQCPLSRPTEARKPHTMMGSDSSLRPLEEAAAATLPPKAEEAAAAVADPTSPPYSPPEVAAAAALASPWLKPCDLAYNIKTAVENITWHEACTVWQQCGELQMKSMGACKEGNRRKCLVAVKSYKQAACRRGRP